MQPGFYPHYGAFVFQQGPPIPHPPPKAPKRAAPESEDAAAPKSKKAKSKGKVGADGGSMHHRHGRCIKILNQYDTDTSKRGYNSKKRNEAAQIAAQNGISYPCSFYTLLLMSYFSAIDAECFLLSNA